MNYHNLSNEKLLHLYQLGNFDAFKAFYNKSHKIIFSFILKKTDSIEIAEDIFQETFFRIHKHILTYDSTKNAINWVLTIAQNQVFTAQQKCLKLNNENFRTSPSLAGFQQIDLQNEINELLNILDPKDKNILLERLVNDHSYHDLSKKYKLTATNVRQKISRILKRLKNAT